MFDIFQELSTLIPYHSCQKFRKDSDFLIITNMDNQLFYLNDVASDLFMLCNNKNTIQDIFKIMKTEYQVDSSVLKQDIINIIRDFQWNHIIKLRNYDF